MRLNTRRFVITDDGGERRAPSRRDRTAYTILNTDDFSVRGHTRSDPESNELNQEYLTPNDSVLRPEQLDASAPAQVAFTPAARSDDNGAP